MRKLTLSLLVLLGTLVAHAQTNSPVIEQPAKPQTSESTSAEANVLALKQAEADYRLAVVNSNAEALRRLIADDYSVFNAQGVASKTTKDSTIRDQLSGPIETESYDVFGLEVKIEGSVGTTSGTAYKKQRARSNPNLFQEIAMKFTRTWVLDSRGGWQVRKLVSQVVERKLGDMPVISNVSVFETQGLLTRVHLALIGLNLGGSGVNVTINGKRVSNKVLEQNHSIIKIEGTKRELNLNAKSPNEISVEVGGKASNTYVFRYGFSSL
jgi:hypothetical protein